MSNKKTLTLPDLALYIGQKFQLFSETTSDGLEYDGIGTLVSVDINPGTCKWPLRFDVKATFTTQRLYYPIDWVRPILRHIEDISEQEALELHRIVFGLDYAGFNTCVNWFLQNSQPAGVTRLGFLIGEPTCWRYLLSIGVDVFGWIDAGLAIDAKTLQTENA